MPLNPHERIEEALIEFALTYGHFPDGVKIKEVVDVRKEACKMVELARIVINFEEGKP